MATTIASFFQRAARHEITTLAATVAICGLLACLLSTPALAKAPSRSSLAKAASTNCSLYASASGRDSNSGTSSAPFLTVKRLIESLTAGQTGCLSSGQTFAGFTLYEGDSHGAEGAPVTITSTNPESPATINTRITTEQGSDWLTFTHLILKSDAVSTTENPSPTINSAHTSWTYDDISGGGINICVLPSQPSQWGAAEYTLIEHDRIHDCGRPVTSSELDAQADDIYEGRLNGWHAHGVYDDGLHTTIRNSYFYDNSSKGVLLRGGSYAVIEHNVIDHNGSGVLFGDEGPAHDLVAWNIITNSTSPCSRETGWCDAFGIWSYCQRSCTADSAVNNDVFGNDDGNIAPSYDLCSCIEVRHNIEVDPLYVNAAANEYTLRAGSPAVGYGPDTAQPTSTALASRQTTSASAQGRHRAARQRARVVTSASGRGHRNVKHAKRHRNARSAGSRARRHRRRMASRGRHGDTHERTRLSRGRA